MRILFHMGITLLGLWLVGWGVFVMEIQRFKPMTGVTPLAVVFTGAEGRIQEALRLLTSGQVERVFISGVQDETTPEVFHAVYPASEGWTEEALALGYQAKSTVGNAYEVRAWLEKYAPQGGKMRLITSDYHMPRSLLEMKRLVTPGIEIVPHPCVYKPGFVEEGGSSDVRGENKRGMKYMQLLFLEYNKFLFQYVKYGLTELVRGERIIGA